MKGFSQFEQPHLRLAVLQILAEDAGYSANEGMLSAALKWIGHGISRDRLRTELAWLAEQDLVRVEDVCGLRVARLTQRGEDVARGRAQVPGVARPGPGG